MSTVHAPASPFNPIHAADRAGDNAPALIPSGHADEIAVDTTDADDDARHAAYWAEFEQGMVEWENDRAIQAADEVHAAHCTAAINHGKALAGNVAIEIVRDLIVASDGNRITYDARLTGSTFTHCGTGNSPLAAVEHAIETLDLIYLAGEFGGFKVAALAFVAGFPHRGREEARQLARRITIDPSYLDVALSLHIDGVTDLRPRPAVAAA